MQQYTFVTELDPAVWLYIFIYFYIPEETLSALLDTLIDVLPFLAFSELLAFEALFKLMTRLLPAPLCFFFLASFLMSVFSTKNTDHKTPRRVLSDTERVFAANVF